VPTSHIVSVPPAVLPSRPSASRRPVATSVPNRPSVPTKAPFAARRPVTSTIRPIKKTEAPHQPTAAPAAKRPTKPLVAPVVKPTITRPTSTRVPSTLPPTASGPAVTKTPASQPASTFVPTSHTVSASPATFPSRPSVSRRPAVAPTSVTKAPFINTPTTNTVEPATTPSVTEKPSVTPSLPAATGRPSVTSAIPVATGQPSAKSISPAVSRHPVRRTTSPAAFPFSSSPTASPTVSTHQVTPFTITYNGTGKPISPAQFNETADLTMLYLQDWLRQTLVFEGATVGKFTWTANVSRSTDPVQISYTLEPVFSPTSSFVPSKDQLNHIVVTGFMQPAVQTLLLNFQNLPSNNPFSNVTEVAYDPTSAVTAVKSMEINGMPVSNSKSSSIFTFRTAAATPGGLCVLAVGFLCLFLASAFVVTVRNKRKRVMGKRIGRTSERSLYDASSRCLLDDNNNCNETLFFANRDWAVGIIRPKDTFGGKWGTKPTKSKTGAVVEDMEIEFVGSRRQKDRRKKGELRQNRDLFASPFTTLSSHENLL
jgi:hypothetical protein